MEVDSIGEETGRPERSRRRGSSPVTREKYGGDRSLS